MISKKDNPEEFSRHISEVQAKAILVWHNSGRCETINTGILSVSTRGIEKERVAQAQASGNFDVYYS